MTTYETIVACVAVTNLAFTLAVFLANRGKAAAAALQDLATEVRGKVHAHEVQLARLVAQAEKAPSHSDLKSIYDSLNGVRSQVDSIGGELEQMNANLRALMTQSMRGTRHDD